MDRGIARLPVSAGAYSPETLFGWARLPTLRDRPLAYLLLLPSVMLILMLVVIPFGQAFFYSFTDKDTVAPEFEFVGIDNYLSFVRQPDFPEAFRNSVVWTVCSDQPATR